MTESSVPHPIAGALVAVLIVGGIGYGVARGLMKAPKHEQQLDQALFEPYFSALADGHVDEAWQRYTTPRYKQLFPLEDYRRHWAGVFSQSGHIGERKLFAANEAYEVATRRQYTAVKYQLTFERAYVQASYEVVADSTGMPRIDWAGQHHAASSSTAPEPW